MITPISPQPIIPIVHNTSRKKQYPLQFQTLRIDTLAQESFSFESYFMDKATPRPRAAERKRLICFDRSPRDILIDKRHLHQTSLNAPVMELEIK